MAYEFYISIDCPSQGKLHGECERETHTEQLVGVYFEAGLASPRDPLSGQATGRRRHQPIMFRKRVGAASPQLAAILCANKRCDKVRFDFARSDEEGNEIVAYAITLEKATIASIKLVVPETDQATSSRDFYEEVTMTFQKITWEHVQAKTIATDDWNATGDAKSGAKTNNAAGGGTGSKEPAA